MRNRRNKKGFSLAEVLLAVCTLAVGMIFVAGVFPLGMLFTTISTERTIAAVAADEAFAKVRIYGINLEDPRLALGQIPFEEVALTGPDPIEFAYPSTDDVVQKRYYWSAICRLPSVGKVPEPGAGGRLVQVTVFVCRRASLNAVYWDPVSMLSDADRPMAFPVGVSGAALPDQLTIPNPDERKFINDGYTIVDDQTGLLYRVLKRYQDDPATPVDEGELILLDRAWEGPSPPAFVWVVPAPAGGGRYPCVAVYQRLIEF